LLTKYGYWCAIPAVALHDEKIGEHSGEVRRTEIEKRAAAAMW